MSNQPLEVYFDTNVFLHLHRQNNGVTLEHHQKLLKLIENGKLCVLFALINFEEIVTCSLPKFPKAEIDTALEIVSPYLMLLQHSEIIENDLKAFCSGERFLSPFDLQMDDASRHNLVAHLRNNDMSFWNDVLKTSDDEKRKFAVALKEDKTKMQDTVADFRVKNRGNRPKFRQYYEASLPRYVDGVLEGFDIRKEDCLKHTDLNQIFKVRSVCLGLGYFISLIFAHHFEGQEPDFSDKYDQWHAVNSSAANIFVTHDHTFARLLERIPVDNYIVKRHLSDLLDEFQG